MAEGDTIHRTAARLQEGLAGKTLRSVSAPAPQSPLRRQTARLATLEGGRLKRASARGKHLFLHFAGGLVLHAHQGISGSWHLRRPGQGGRPREAAWLVLETADLTAAQYGGPRLRLLTEGELRGDLRLRALGPDLLAASFSPDAAVARLRAADQARGLGDALLDQSLLSGIGNVFKNEACFATRLDPWRPLREVSDDELREVVTVATEMMEGGLRTGRRPHEVYRRAGRPCPRCGARIASRGQGDANRITYWCPSCQARSTPDGSREHPPNRR